MVRPQMDDRCDAVIVVGPLERIEEADDGACILLGYERSELVGLHGTELVPTERHQAVAVTVDRMREGAMTGWRTGRLLRKDGREVEVEVNGQTLPNGRLAFRIRVVRVG